MIDCRRFPAGLAWLAILALSLLVASTASSDVLVRSVGAVKAENHIVITVEQTEAEIAWLAQTTHSEEEKRAFLTAFEVATAISDEVDAHYEASLAPGHHSFLEEYGISFDEEMRQAEQELNEWHEEARMSHHSFAEVQAFHSTEVENELLAQFTSSSLQELEADIDAEMEWPQWADNAMANAKKIGSEINDGIQAVNKGVNFVGAQLDKVQNGIEDVAHKVTKATHTEFLNGAIDAGVSMAMTAGPLGTFRAIQAGVNTAAAVSQGLKTGGLKGAFDAGKGALVDAAKNYVMSKIPGGKILELAMSGPVGKMVEKLGKKALDSPAAKKLLAESQKFLASKIMKSPLAKALIKKVESQSGAILAKGKELALNYVNDKIQEKTGLNLNLATGGKLDLSKRGLLKSAKSAVKEIGREAARNTLEKIRETGQAELDRQSDARGEARGSSDLSSLDGVGAKLKDAAGKLKAKRDAKKQKGDQGGNSSAARSARAKAQARDSKGRFAKGNKAAKGGAKGAKGAKGRKANGNSKAARSARAKKQPRNKKGQFTKTKKKAAGGKSKSKPKRKAPKKQKKKRKVSKRKVPKARKTKRTVKKRKAPKKKKAAPKKKKIVKRKVAKKKKKAAPKKRKVAPKKKTKRVVKTRKVAVAKKKRAPVKQRAPAAAKKSAPVAPRRAAPRRKL